MTITIGIADDHTLVLKSLAVLINGISPFRVVLEAHNGEQLLTGLRQADTLPDILLVDVNMPVMNGIRTAAMLKKDYPMIKTIALSMKTDDPTIISMFRVGCCAYLPKDIHPNELEKALLAVHTRGYYNADSPVYSRRFHPAGEDKAIDLSPREKTFLTHACSDLTYKEIASLMSVSDRTVDGYRDSLFQKLNVKSRVGMALEAIRRNIVNI
jgi:DNA-binding NarL/FixJ family response regulator